MNQITRVLSLVAAGLALTSQAADLYYDFETGADGWGKGTWSSTGPASIGAGSFKAGPAAGGWIWSMEKNFTTTENAEIATMAGFGASAVLQFDLIVDHTKSFPAGSNTWFQINLAGNSAGTAGWSQFADIFKPDGWHDQTSTGTLTKSFTYTFPQIGFEPGDAWYQLNIGANSEASVPVSFFIDNVRLTVVPEPGVLALGLLGAGLLVARRRIS